MVDEFVFNYIKNAHKGQTRLDKSTPYWTHPLAVADMSLSLAKKHKEVILKNIELEYDVISTHLSSIHNTALLHDVIEDCPEYTNNKIAIDLYGHPYDAKALDLLTHIKDRQDSYVNYIEKIVVSNNVTAIIIKLADSLHNSITCPKDAKCMLTKFNLTSYILQNKLNELSFKL